MIKLNESHASLCQAARDQTIVGETGLARLRSIFREHRSGLFPDVHGVSSIHLHAKRQFVLGDASNSLGISKRGIGLLIDLIDRVQHSAAQRAGHLRRIVQVEHRFAVRTALHALINAWQETGTPELLAAVGRLASREQDDESRQILVLGAKSINDPRTERGIAQASVTRVHQQLRRCVIELIGVHRFDEADVVDVIFKMRQAIGYPMTTLSDLAERILRS